MGISVLKIYKYSMKCDICGIIEVLHSGDHPNDVYVHNIHTAIKGAGFHRSKGRLLCDDCFYIFGGKVKEEKVMERRTNKIKRGIKNN